VRLVSHPNENDNRQNKRQFATKEKSKFLSNIPLIGEGMLSHVVLG
jgi:hypothetical protein